MKEPHNQNNNNKQHYKTNKLKEEKKEMNALQTQTTVHKPVNLSSKSKVTILFIFPLRSRSGCNGGGMILIVIFARFLFLSMPFFAVRVC